VAESIQIPESEPPRGRTDRRQRPTPMFSRYTLFGRRKGNRRTTDPRRNYFVDKATGANLVALILVCLLILIDTVSTLHIVRMGGGEANPIMRWMLEFSPLGFALAKLLTAVAAFVVLTVHCKYPVMRPLTVVLLLAYGVLVCYHVVLLLRIHG
jgi:hypothetical protein